MAGTLTLAGTDLGNRLDMPARSLAALQTADLLVFEGARNARAFLKTAGIHRDFLCYSEHQEKATLQSVREALQSGQHVLYMSDQGMPNFADPGAALADIAFALGAQLTIIPGPSALTAALAACPFATEPFYFAGFLPRDANERQRSLRSLESLGCALVIMDTPYRQSAVLRDCQDILGARDSLLATDISGPSEAFSYAPLRKQRASTEKLNFVLVIGLKNKKRGV